jgi:putative ABC transport system permease protein
MGFYRLFLRLCPASFRNEYGGEMQAVFGRRLREASWPGAIWLWFDALADLLLAAIASHASLLAQDLKYTRRSAAKAPGFTAVVIAVAALGVAAATSVFSIADHVLLRALPFREPGRLVKLWEDQTQRGYPRNNVSPANYRDWKDASQSFESMVAYRGLSVNMSGVGEPERISGYSVNHELFAMLGVSAAAGRVFTAQDDRPKAPGTVILSHGFWQQRFGGDVGVIGRRVQFDQELFTIIGVMPASFRFPARDARIWTAMRFEEGDFADRGNYFLDVIARLKPGVTFEQAAAGMRVIGGNLEKRYPAENGKSNVMVVRMRDEVPMRSRTILMVLGAAAFFLLIIACSNLANLLLARAAGRGKEIAIRTALGAGRERLIRQLLTESVVLAAGGGLIGTMAAATSLPLLARLVPTTLPISEMPAMDWRVLLFAVGVTVFTGVVFGVMPALRATAAELSLRGSTGGRQEGLRRALVVTQVAGSVALVVSTGLLVRAITTLQNTNPGFGTEHVLTFRTSLPMPKYETDIVRERYYARVLGDVRALPGVRAAAAISFRPMGDFRGGIWSVLIPGTNQRDPHAAARFITPGYFTAMRIPLLYGRDIEASDRAGGPMVAVVSESFVKQHWPGETGLGRSFGIRFGALRFTIVGVAAHVRFRGLDRVSEPQMYFASAQMPDGSFTWFAPKDFMIAAASDPMELMPAIRRIVAGADPTQPISEVQTVADLVEDDTAARRTQLWVIGAFSAAAFLLASIGIHGLLSFAVSQRAVEIGLRRALGAQAGDIAWMVLGEAIVLAGVGAVIGLTGAYLLGRSMQALLAGVAAADARTMAGALGAACLMTLLGTLVPSIRALRVDPARTLRGE